MLKITSKFILSLFILLSAVSTVFGQYDYQIPKGSAEAVNGKYKVDPVFFTTKKLVWGNVESSCISQNVEFGFWLKVEVKSGQTKVSITNLADKNSIDKPTLYLGKVENTSQGRRLTEIKCVKFDQTSKNYALEATGLNAETEYFLLIAGSKLGERFGVEVTEKFTPTSESILDVKKEPTVSIVGRVRDKNGNSKAGVRVTLLNGLMQKVSNTASGTDGSFSFEKLPQDEVFITKIEEEDPELQIDIFLKNAEGTIVSRATKIGGNMFGFGASEDSFTDLKLLTSMDWALNVAKGKTGIAGRVVDANTFLFGRSGLKVGLYNASKTLLNSTSTDANGNFQFRDLEQGEYLVRLEQHSENDYSEVVLVDDLNVPYAFGNSSQLGADGFFKFEKLPADIVELKHLEERDTRLAIDESDFSTIAKGQTIILKNILFETGSAQLKESSFTELNKLAAELKKQPGLKIEISGHTDNVGNEATNKLISENRAKAVKDYLVKMGVAVDRISTIGYGSKKPIADNNSDEGRRENRRVEFTVTQ